MRKAVVAAILAVLVVASFGAGYLAGSGAKGTVTSTTTPTSMSTEPAILVPGAAATATHSNSSSGVDLVLAVNATTLYPGQSLNIDVALFNARPSTNSVATSKDWPFQGVPVALWPPCYFDLPAEAVVLKGNLTLQGLRSAANVTFGYQCAEGVDVSHVVFQPNSSMANLTGLGGFASGSGNFTLGPHRLSLTFATNGYWDLMNNSRQLNQPIIGQTSPPAPPVATPFTPGVYTVAIADEWGQTAILHFTVNADPAAIGASLDKAVGYLIGKYNPVLGLIPETPNSTTYWLYSDNYLAALALQHYAEGRYEYATLEFYAGNITRSMNAELALNHISGAENQYLALNSSVPCEFNASQNYPLGGPPTALIKATLNNGTGRLSESQYADIAFLSSICFHLQNNTAGAMASYKTGRAMFDGAGLNDSVLADPGPDRGQYQTFKLALYIYASALLHQPVDPSAVSILLSMQAPGGGFYTGYDSSLSHEGTLTNTETTSLAILALHAVLSG